MQSVHAGAVQTHFSSFRLTPKNLNKHHLKDTQIHPKSIEHPAKMVTKKRAGDGSHKKTARNQLFHFFYRTYLKRGSTKEYPFPRGTLLLRPFCTCGPKEPKVPPKSSPSAPTASKVHHPGAPKHRPCTTLVQQNDTLVHRC